MLLNQETKGALVIDIGERVVGNDEAYACTTNSNGIGAVTRSVFIIEKADQKDGYVDDIVHYNQKIRISSNPLLFPKTLYLRSLPISPLHFARFSRKQEVALQTDLNYDTVWILEHQDPNQRFKAERNPVKVNDGLLIKHCATDHHLASQFVEYKNDFGIEFETSCFSYTTQNKSQQLNLEKAGMLSKDHPTKFSLSQNIWVISTSTDKSTDVPLKDAKKELSDGQFMQFIKGAILNNGLYGIRKLELCLRACESSNSGSIELNQFYKCLNDCGIMLSEEETKRLLKIIGGSTSERVSYVKFINMIRGQLNQNRKAILEELYNTVSNQNGGSLTIDDVAKRIDITSNPLVTRGKQKLEDVYMEYMNGWSSNDPNHAISIDEFMEYYSDIAAAFDDNDDQFIEFLKVEWKI